MFSGGGVLREGRSGVVYAREVSTPDMLDHDKSDSDGSEHDENMPKFANSQGNKK